MSPAIRSELALRPLVATNAHAIERLLVGLDMAARCARFGWACNDEALVRHIDSRMADAAHVIGAFVGGELVGMIELYREPSAARVEAALVVDARWRRQGLGRALLDAARDWAGVHRITTIRLIFGRHNWPMRKLVAKANARLDIVLDDICSEIAISRKSEPTRYAASDSRALAAAESSA